MNTSMLSLNQIIEEYKDNIPVPILEIAQKLNLKVFNTNSLKEKESGLIRVEDNAYVIYVNESHSSKRKRFTIAHEIIHFLLHKDFIDESYITPSKQPIMSAENINLTVDEQQREVEANKFAAKLLMPEEQFKKVWMESDSIEAVSNIFQVSVSAAAIRGDKLLDQIML